MLLYQIYIFILGLVFGSFVAAFSYRYPRGISVGKGRSFCDNCHKQISWFDNIPLLSFLVLGGKCRYCRKAISWRYFLIELLTGIGFLILGFQIFHLVLFLLLELIFIIDLENQIIPDIFIFIALLLSLFLVQSTLLSSLFSGFLCASFLLLIHLITKGRGMGLGDVKLAVLGGILVGLSFSWVWIFISFLSGALIGVVLILFGDAKLKTKIAFGPFLAAAIPITFLFGETVLRLIGLK